MQFLPRLGAALLCLVALVHSAGAQQLYKSVGPDGRVVYSDRPVADARVEKAIKYEEQPGSSLEVRSSSYVEQLRRLRASSPPEVPAAEGTVLYIAKWCGYCKQAKAFLASRNIGYREFDIDTPEGLAAFANAGGRKGVPLLIHGAARVQGFSRTSYDAVFSNAK